MLLQSVPSCHLRKQQMWVIKTQVITFAPPSEVDVRPKLEMSHCYTCRKTSSAH